MSWREMESVPRDGRWLILQDGNTFALDKYEPESWRRSWDVDFKRKFRATAWIHASDWR